VVNGLGSCCVTIAWHDGMRWRVADWGWPDMLRIVSTDIFNGHERASRASPKGGGHLGFVRIRAQHAAFDPEIILRLDIAYHAVRYRLGLKDVEDPATLCAAKEIINLASDGERDPERLTAETIRRLEHVLPRSPADYRKFAR
jgi:hypothetical protein